MQVKWLTKCRHLVNYFAPPLHSFSRLFSEYYNYILGMASSQRIVILCYPLFSFQKPKPDSSKVTSRIRHPLVSSFLFGSAIENSPAHIDMCKKKDITVKDGVSLNE